MTRKSGSTLYNNKILVLSKKSPKSKQTLYFHFDCIVNSSFDDGLLPCSINYLK